MSLFFIMVTLLMGAVLYYDIRHYLIPNWIVGLMLLMYPLAVWMSPVAVDWQISALLALAVFATGYLIFILRWMGGGDIKLLVACSLWVGWGGFADFLFLVALWGGVLAVILLVARIAVSKYLYWTCKQWKLPRLLTHNAPVPYGVAIAGVFLWLMWSDKVTILPMV